MNPQLLMLDEPTSGLEPSLVNVIVEQIKYARELGKSVFIIEHNMNVIMNLAEKIFVLHNGARSPKERREKLGQIHLWLMRTWEKKKQELRRTLDPRKCCVSQR